MFGCSCLVSLRHRIQATNSSFLYLVENVGIEPLPKTPRLVCFRYTTFSMPKVEYLLTAPPSAYMKEGCCGRKMEKTPTTLAGVGGFEPPNARVKVLCLAAWLYPIVAASVGFEPTGVCNTNGLANRHNKPLCQLTVLGRSLTLTRR